MIDLENVNTSRVGLVHEEEIMSQSTFDMNQLKKNKPKICLLVLLQLIQKKFIILLEVVLGHRYHLVIY